MGWLVCGDGRDMLLILMLLTTLLPNNLAVVGFFV